MLPPRSWPAVTSARGTRRSTIIWRTAGRRSWRAAARPRTEVDRHHRASRRRGVARASRARAGWMRSSRGSRLPVSHALEARHTDHDARDRERAIARWPQRSGSRSPAGSDFHDDYRAPPLRPRPDHADRRRSSRRWRRDADDAPVIRIDRVQKNYGGAAAAPDPRSLGRGRGARGARRPRRRRRRRSWSTWSPAPTLPDEGTIETFGVVHRRHHRRRCLARIARPLRHRQPARGAARGLDAAAEPRAAVHAARSIRCRRRSRAGRRARGGMRDCRGASVADRAAELPPHLRVRAHLARALALNPRAAADRAPDRGSCDEAERPALARDFAARARGPRRRGR